MKDSSFIFHFYLSVEDVLDVDGIGEFVMEGVFHHPLFCRFLKNGRGIHVDTCRWWQHAVSCE